MVTIALQSQAAVLHVEGEVKELVYSPRQQFTMLKERVKELV